MSRDKAGTGPDPDGATAIVYVSPAVPVLERLKVSVFRIENAPEPKLSDVGYAATVPFKAAARFRTPAPACCTPAALPASLVAAVALLMRSDRYCCCVSPGRADFKTAAAPAARGAEKLVPAVSI